MKEELQPCKKMCDTCPFKEGSPLAYLLQTIKISSLTNTRICHSTGGRNAINKKGSKRLARICRGSRDFQLQIMYRMGIISAATDEAWSAKFSKKDS